MKHIFFIRKDLVVICWNSFGVKCTAKKLVGLQCRAHVSTYAYSGELFQIKLYVLNMNEIETYTLYELTFLALQFCNKSQYLCIQVIHIFKLYDGGNHLLLIHDLRYNEIALHMFSYLRDLSRNCKLHLRNRARKRELILSRPF